MSVEIFTKEQFEKALPVHKTSGVRLWEPLGLLDGEWAYRVRVDDKSAIEVRSSVGSDGFSADTGQDSIRCWLVGPDGRPLGSKVSRWTTRLPGWQERLTPILRTLWEWRKAAGDCPCCNEPKKIFKVKKDGPRKGWIFAKCDTHEDQFRWLKTQ